MTPEQHVDIELFAGAGGLTLGLSDAGLAPHHVFEVDKHCCATLRHNSGGLTPRITAQIHQEDVRNVDWSRFREHVRLLSAGPPCQPFSHGGKHLADRDDRNQFPATLRAVRQLKPAIILLENVAGLARRSFAPYLRYIVKQLEYPSLPPRPKETWQDHDHRLQRHQAVAKNGATYRVQKWILNAADYGVAQARVRVFLVASRVELPAIEVPPPTHSRLALLERQERGHYWREHGLQVKTRDQWPRRARGPGNGAGRDRLPWVTVRTGLQGLPPPTADDRRDNNHYVIPGARLYNRHSGSELDWPAKTIKAGVHGVGGGENVLLLDNGEQRYFTLREMALLQGFPSEYHFTGPRSRIVHQIGNAVPCGLAQAIGQQLSIALRGFAAPHGAEEGHSAAAAEAALEAAIPKAG
jgi:DNA (cytosine-5)-methyltransferase 1